MTTWLPGGSVNGGEFASFSNLLEQCHRRRLGLALPMKMAKAS